MQTAPSSNPSLNRTQTQHYSKQIHSVSLDSSPSQVTDGRSASNRTPHSQTSLPTIRMCQLLPQLNTRKGTRVCSEKPQDLVLLYAKQPSRQGNMYVRSGAVQCPAHLAEAPSQDPERHWPTWEDTYLKPASPRPSRCLPPVFAAARA